VPAVFVAAYGGAPWCFLDSARAGARCRIALRFDSGRARFEQDHRALHNARHRSTFIRSPARASAGRQRSVRSGSPAGTKAAVVNILYEEQGDYKVATVLADNDTSLQVETASGKRAKVKAAHVLLRFQERAIGGFLADAQRIADTIDSDFLWQCCGPEEFGFEPLAGEYFGRAPSPAEAAGLLLKLHAAPMYFYRRGKGRFKAAPEESLKAALAGMERKRQQAAQQQRYVSDLLAGRLPPEFEPLRERLLYKPDRSTVEAKALDEASAVLKLSPAKVFRHCGALGSTHDYHLRKFLSEHFPGGVGFGELPIPEAPAGLRQADAPARSIDDAATTEIDDAFSVVMRPDGGVRVGVHIAAPALGIAIDSALDLAARARLSTVYMPGSKITMLPDAAIERFTLSAGRPVPALSFYAEFTPELEMRATESRIEAVRVEENLRHESLDAVFNVEAVAAGRVEHACGAELLALHAIATRLEAARGKAEPPREGRAEYTFRVENDRVDIIERRRGSPIDRVVSELMILVNTRWARLLDEHGCAGVFRSQQDGRVKLSGVASAHQGLGVQHYIWASSPLRRYVALMTPRQLIALRRAEPPPYARNGEALFAAMRAFELAHEAYNDFQRQMERYWCLRWIEQEAAATLTGAVIRDNLVRLDRLPLVVRVLSAPELASGTAVEVAVTAVDLIDLTVDCEFRRALA
jgi:exoribonuclease-2